jgi:hypothetical protein
MKIIQKSKRKEYPYLAVMGNYDKDTSYDINDIMIISKIPNKDKEIYVQHLNGSQEGWFTKEENTYTPLPNGYEITITQ